MAGLGQLFLHDEVKEMHSLLVAEKIIYVYVIKPGKCPS